MQSVVVCALYKFVRLENYRQLRDPLLEVMLNHSVRGTLLLATEGINGTIAGDRNGVDAVLQWLRSTPVLADLECKESITTVEPFKRSRVKIKKEIVTLGVEGLDPAHTAGTYVAPKDWNALISDPDVLLIDTRNDYECDVGSFEGAVNPDTASFRDFPAYVADSLHGSISKTQKVAMFCTGGIRCEKSTAYLRSLGYEEVYHLQGGILKYLEEVPESESMWQGECFVFDERVTVNHQLEKGSYDQCHACRRPITEDDKGSEYYVQGVSCARCYHSTSSEDKLRFSQREKQMQLSRKRGEKHMGEGARQQLLEKRALRPASEQND